MSLQKLLLLFIAALFTVGCDKQSADNTPSGPTAVDEISECTTATTYSPAVTLTGVAQFFKRSLTVSVSGSGDVTALKLDAPTSTGLPIRFAEVRVINSSGAIVQCGKTNASGQLKALDGVSDLTISNTSGSYSIEVLSRVNHSMPVPGGKPAYKAYAAVKKDIYSNTVYKVTATVNSSGNGSYNSTLTATASESTSADVEGGAFNIYNNLISTYDYIANNTSTTDISCLNPKLDIFWKAGFNPAQYIYPEENPSDLSTISFYLRGENELYISGGILGDIKTQDTDHFDDTVIIHEIGHHIEDVCGTMESPGGSHYGRFRIDPRLAWSEGWGNFLGAHIVKNKLAEINPDLPALLPNGWLTYFDSQGYGTTGYEYIRINLGRKGNSTTELIHYSDGNANATYDPVDPAAYPGEGHFREVSVARGLFKGTNTCTVASSSNCVGANYFSDYWKAFESRSAGIGMGKSIYPFRSFVRFIERLTAVQTTLNAGLNTLFTTDEALQPSDSADYVVSGDRVWVPYGVNLVSTGSTPCSIHIQPRVNTYIGDSDQRYSNHFYTFDKNLLAGVTSIQINRTNLAGTNNLSIDALVFKQSYRFNEDCGSYDAYGDCAAPQQTTSSDVVTYARTGAYPRTLSLSNLTTSQKYMLNIRAYTPSTVLSSTEYSYTLQDQVGNYLCPSNTY